MFKLKITLKSTDHLSVTLKFLFLWAMNRMGIKAGDISTPADVCTHQHEFKHTKGSAADSLTFTDPPVSLCEHFSPPTS